MLRNRYFAPSFSVLVAMAALHWLAAIQGYYWTVGWYDFMMHFLGGAWAALFILWVSEASYGALLKPLLSPRRLVAFAFLVGLAWELLELALGITDMAMRGYAWDTAHDLVMDVVGAAVIALLARRYLRKAGLNETRS